MLSDLSITAVMTLLFVQGLGSGRSRPAVQLGEEPSFLGLSQDEYGAVTMPILLTGALLVRAL